MSVSIIDLNRLTELAKCCRNGLASLRDRPGSMFFGFPVGACGPAAELIGRVIKEDGGYDGIYVCGSAHRQLSPSQTHAWYEVGTYIIDITYDQFEGTGLSGWIFPKGSGWHAEFQELDVREGYCMPAGWPCYPFDGFQAVKTFLRGCN